MALLNKTLAAAGLAVMTMIGSATVQAQSLHLGHIVPPSHIWHQVAERFATNLEKASDGRLSTRISPQARLGGDPQLIRLLQSGGIQLAILTVGDLSNRNEALQAWFLPYTFKDIQHAAAAAHTPAAREMLAQLAINDMVGLGYLFAGMRHVLSVRPVTSPADLESQKIRSFPNEIFSDWWQAMGAEPIELSLSEVPQALSSGLLDTVDITLDAVIGLKLYQQASYLTPTNHMAFPAVMVVSKTWWDQQSAADQALIQQVFDEAQVWGTRKQIADEAANLETLKTAGVHIQAVDLGHFHEVGTQVAGDYASTRPLIKTFAAQAAALGQ